MIPEILKNRYRTLHPLSSGGFGETFLAEDLDSPTKRRCVIKQLKPVTDDSQAYEMIKERFQREAIILEDLGEGQSQIPSLYAYFELEERFYLVQEYIQGEMLNQQLQQQGIFSESHVRDLLINLLPTLNYIHDRGIIHRDIKPNNIIVRSADRKPVLIDFGAVRETMGTVVTPSGTPTSSIVIGTPGFMPSEQGIGRPVFSSDLYSLGLTAIYLLTGKIPQELATDPRTGEIVWREFAVNVSPSLGNILDKAIKSHVRDRFSAAREMLESLQSKTVPIAPTVTSIPSVQSSSQTVVTTPTKSDRERNNATPILLGSLMIGGLACAGIVLGFVLTRSPQPESSQSQVSEEKEIVASPSDPSPVQEETITTPSNQLNSTPIVVPEPVAPEPVFSPPTTTNVPPQPSGFYIIQDSAYATINDAQNQVQNLKTSGYNGANHLWIPDYPNLSGKSFYSVYPASFSNRSDCANFLQQYSRRNPNSYCVYASKNPADSADRFYP
ncbi:MULTISPECIES: protein kinase [Spirulina sp. CCY15215]|uniref:protein kinase domain-containing protein n=1 Tax=Spirulina sp. CCY15215 TaxID=2767591 RepID=UPI0019516654|nr:protein kinase [Spirulina major]